MIELRDFMEEDVGQLVQILNDSDVCQYLSTKIPQPYTQDDARWWVSEGSKSEFVKAITKNGVLVGCIGVIRGQFEYERCGELGYWLDKAHWRQGLGKLAIKQITDFVFLHSNIERIYACVFAKNEASKRLLLTSGFQQEGIFRRAIYKNSQYHDSHIFSKLRLS